MRELWARIQVIRTRSAGRRERARPRRGRDFITQRAQRAQPHDTTILRGGAFGPSRAGPLET